MVAITPVLETIQRGTPSMPAIVAVLAEKTKRMI